MSGGSEGGARDGLHVLTTFTTQRWRLDWSSPKNLATGPWAIACVVPERGRSVLVGKGDCFAACMLLCFLVAAVHP